MGHVKQHNSNQDRLLQNLVDSLVQRHAHCIVQCPIYLAEELNRSIFNVERVEGFVKLYQQRMA
eukprot:2418893-Lingulodinium_polyedra.AAC.1